MGNGRVRTVAGGGGVALPAMAAGLEGGAEDERQTGRRRAIKKKTVVALARLLAIDLWRWRTGRATLADLGWIPA